MDRRKSLKFALGGLAGTASGALVLSTCFKTPFEPDTKSEILSSDQDRKAAEPWVYSRLDPDATADAAYKHYADGSCMYAVFKSVVGQLGEKLGEPYTNFPFAMMRYGNGGIAGFGSVCGALNGAAAVMGLFITDKKRQAHPITDLFTWYEKTQLPVFVPNEPKLDFDVPPSVSESVLCHASTTKWGKATGHKIGSKQQKERCTRLAADVAKQTVNVLNTFFDNKYVASNKLSTKVNTCLSCHSNKGKLSNTRGHMDCTSCHTPSLGHKIFADAHYKMMKKEAPDK